MDRYGSSGLAARLAPTSALTAGFEANKRMASQLSRLVAAPRFEFPIPAFPKFESPPALIGLATRPGAIDLFHNSTILAGFSTLRDALTTATAAFEHSGTREVIDWIAKPPDYFIPEFSIFAFPELRFTNAAVQDDCDDPANAVGRAWRQIAEVGSPRGEDRPAVHVVTKRVGKGLLLLIKWGGVTVATIVAKHYLEPYLVLLPQP